ncbi:MAG TPA: hypothetical protein VEO02_01275 [Thermoanaerobaculia bacterium]|nr:hypothetical protein [Thermoanaerobaculia bacterium]
MSKEVLQKEDRDLIRPRELSRTPDPAIGIEGFNSQSERQPKGRILTAVEQCDGWDPFELLLRVPKDRVPHIYVDAKKFLKLLIDHGNEFTYSQWKGRHEDSYWAQEVKHSMAVEYAVIQRSLAKEKK